MKKYLMMFGATGLLATMMMVSGCGSNDDSTVVVPTTTTTATTTSTAATTTSTAATTTSTAATTTSTAATTSTTAVPTTTTTTLPATVNVSTGGTSNAAASNVSYVFAAGTYTYTIAGFNTGDKLTFPAGTTPSVFNDSWIDGNVPITCSSSAGLITVTLTGQTANDSSLNSIAAFNTVFGAATIN
jgi:hypothetical protein